MSAVLSVYGTALLSEVCDDAHRSKFLGAFFLTAPLGSAVGFVLGGACAFMCACIMCVRCGSVCVCMRVHLCVIACVRYACVRKRTLERAHYFLTVPTLGFFVDEVSWRWCFWFTAICELLLACAWSTMKPPNNHSTKRTFSNIFLIYS